MHAIFKFWVSSLYLLHPYKLFVILKSSVKTFVRGLWWMTRMFGWLIAVDIFLLYSLGGMFAKTAALQADGVQTTNAPMLLLILIQSIIWFLIHSSFFLFLRKSDGGELRIYFRNNFIRYTQLMLAFSFFMLLGLGLLINCGITKLPETPWWVLITVKMVEILTAFYWLDSSHRIFNLLLSLEKTINLIFYNLPFVFLLSGTLWLFDYGLCKACSMLFNVTPSHLFFIGINTLLKPSTSSSALWKIIIIKYLMFIVEGYWMSLLLAFYRRKKDEPYASSIFIPAS